MEVSIVIPTYNRVNEIKKIFDSLIGQTIIPKEVKIVDDSTNSETKDLVLKCETAFEAKGTNLKYIHNESERSLTAARNIGVEHSKCEIILFLDDDVILDKNYIKEILEVYSEREDALGVQGYISNIKTPKPNILYKIFFLWHFEKNKMRVLPN